MKSGIGIAGLVLVTGLFALADKVELEKKISETNALKIQLEEKNKENLQLQFNLLQAQQKQIGTDYSTAVQRIEGIKAEVCKEAGYKDCTYDLATKVVTEKKSEKK